MEPKAKKSILIIKNCVKPISFSELKKRIDISTQGLSLALKRLQRQELIAKTSDGKYVLTEKGFRVLEEIEIFEFVKRIPLEELKEFEKELQLVYLYRALWITYILFKKLMQDTQLEKRLEYNLQILEKYTSEINPYWKKKHKIKEMKEKGIQIIYFGLDVDDSYIGDKYILIDFKKLKQYIDEIKGLLSVIRIDTFKDEEEKKILLDIDDNIRQALKSITEYYEVYSKKIKEVKEREYREIICPYCGEYIKEPMRSITGEYVCPHCYTTLNINVKPGPTDNMLKAFPAYYRKIMKKAMKKYGLKYDEQDFDFH